MKPSKADLARLSTIDIVKLRIRLWFANLILTMFVLSIVIVILVVVFAVVYIMNGGGIYELSLIEVSNGY